MKIHSITLEHKGDLYTFFEDGGARKNGKFVFSQNIPKSVVLVAGLLFQETMPNDD